MLRDKQGRWYGYSMVGAIVIALLIGGGATKLLFPHTIEVTNTTSFITANHYPLRHAEEVVVSAGMEELNPTPGMEFLIRTENPTYDGNWKDAKLVTVPLNNTAVLDQLPRGTAAFIELGNGELLALYHPNVMRRLDRERDHLVTAFTTAPFNEPTFTPVINTDIGNE